MNPYIYKCELCGTADYDHECRGCLTCGSWDLDHSCNEILDRLVKEHKRQEERRRYLEENPPRYTKLELPENYHPTEDGMAEKEFREKHGYPIMTKEQFEEWTQLQFDLNPYQFEDYCFKENAENCDKIHCGTHVFHKLAQWHDKFWKCQRITSSTVTQKSAPNIDEQKTNSTESLEG